MILTDQIAHAVAAGQVRIAYRRWSRLRVSEGSTFRSVAGVIRIDGIEEIDARSIQEGDAIRAGYDSVTDLVGTFRGKQSDPVYRIDLVWVGEDARTDLANTTNLTTGDVADIDASLDRFDRYTPWARKTLKLLHERPGMKAAELAAHTNLPKESMKRRVRQLRELGLTLSLQSGYELSPRGQAYLRVTADRVYGDPPENEVDR